MRILIKVKMFARFRSRLIPMKSKFILSISLGELQLLQLYSHLLQHHENRPESKCHLRHFKPNSAQPVITSKMFFSSAAWLTMPLTTLNVVLSKAYPMSVSPSIDFLVRWILVTRIVTPSVSGYLWEFVYVHMFFIANFPRLYFNYISFHSLFQSLFSIALGSKDINGPKLQLEN